MTETILVTGANRGLGLEFVRQYAKTGANIIACCRSPQTAQELTVLGQQFANIKVYSLEVTSPASITALAKEIQDPIDVLINNAGLLHQEPPIGDLPIDVFMQTFSVNTVAPLKITEAFMTHVAKSQKKLIVCISSSMGSIAENTSGGYYSYRASKTALNMVMKSAAIDLAHQQIRVLLLHPGWVKTRMGGSEATVEPHESISGMRSIIDSYQSSPGEIQFLRYNGETVPW